MTHQRYPSTATTGACTLLDIYAESEGESLSAINNNDNNDNNDNDNIFNSRIQFNDLKRKISHNMKHNSNNREGPLTHDIYGFNISSQYISIQDYQSWWNDYYPYLKRRKRKWIKFLNKCGCFIDDKTHLPNSFPLKFDELKKFIRKGIPPEWRGKAWFHFVNGDELMNNNKGVYENLILKLNQCKYIDAIEKDLNRTFPDNIYFTDSNNDNNSTNPMLDALSRVLKAFSIYNTKIGYCQSLNFICGMLLIFMSEEEAFWMLTIITDKYLPNVHSTDLSGLTTYQYSLLKCLHDRLPDVWKIIMNNNESDNSNIPTLTFCTTNWFMSLFIGVLPIESTLRIWDIIFYEHPKIILQISLGIFSMLEPELKKCKLMTELFQIIQNTPKRIINVNLFIVEIFRNLITQNEYNKWFNDNERLLPELNGITNWSDDVNIRKLKTAYWNAGLNRRIKKIYTKK